MPQLRVFFFGLICHVGNDPQKQQADYGVIVNAPSHQPCLMWCDAENNVQECDLELEGKDIFIGSLRTRPLPFSDLFEKYVVKLRDLIPTQKTVRRRVRRREDEEEVHAYIVYPAEADNLTVVDLYCHEATHITQYDLPLRKNCVARVTMTQVETQGADVSIGYVKNRRWEELACVPSDGCVLFSNAEPRGSLVAANGSRLDRGHVKLYGGITEDPIDVEVEEDETTDCHLPDPFPADCLWVLEHVRNAANRAAEYSDCGNTGDP